LEHLRTHGQLAVQGWGCERSSCKIVHAHPKPQHLHHSYRRDTPSIHDPGTALSPSPQQHRPGIRTRAVKVSVTVERLAHGARPTDA
jgi:hypothetical protein